MNQVLPVVYLVRHAETAWTLTGQHTGRTDLPLTGQGERQARALGPTLDRMLSPLQGARRTAELAMPLARVEADDELVDHDLTGPVTHAWNGRVTAAASAR